MNNKAQAAQENPTPCCCCESKKDMPQEELFAAIDRIIESVSGDAGALIPVLQSVQNLCGYLSKPALKHISEKLKISYSEVAGVVSFYSYFSTIPRGKYVVRVCLGTACYVRGGKQILDALKEKLKIDVGETTSDQMFSLEVARCFGACALAPTMSIDDEVYKRVRPMKVAEIIDSYYTGKRTAGRVS